jgi:hypothetical protein
LAYKDAEKVHAKFAPSRTTVSHVALSAFGEWVSAAAAVVDLRVGRFVRNETTASVPLGEGVVEVEGTVTALDHARAAWVAISRDVEWTMV